MSDGKTEGKWDRPVGKKITETEPYLQLIDLFTKFTDQFLDEDGNLVVDRGDGRYYRIKVERLAVSETSKWDM